MIRLIGERPLETPALVASYRVGDYPAAGLRCYPWEMTGTQATLVNAFDLLANRRTRTFAEEIRRREGGIHDYVNFDGPVILDSGAYNFMQQQDITVAPADIVDVGLRTEADALVVLDHPFPPDATPDEIQARAERTQANTRTMFESLSSSGIKQDLTLIPVLHGHDAGTLERSLESILAVTGREPEIVGLGSLAPLAKQRHARKAADIILQARRMLPNSHLHVFSMGSAPLMLFAFYCGADTVDSQTWIMTAAFKQVQLPGLYQTRLSRREAEKDPVKYRRTREAFVERLLRLIQHENFTARDWDTGESWPISSEREAFSYLDHLEDRDGENRIHRRACHNLHSFNFEAGRVRRVRGTGSLEELIRERIERTNYRRAFEYVAQKKNTLHLPH